MPEQLYYIAHADNVPSIMEKGILSLNAVKAHPGLLAANIAHPFVQERRERAIVGGRPLHDFVPLYWATHTPMQYGQERSSLVFIVLGAESILNLPGVYSTDGNAASDATQFYEGRGALPHLDWKIIGTSNCYSAEYKGKKCAEVLVPDRVGPELFQRICVCSNDVAAGLRVGVPRLRTVGPNALLIVNAALYY